ncbi:Gti1/Pac2 family-domain-containing protein [Cladorrhinum sp. PSN332]|nr:Gti1/Pac2 family-domain-containing protein [Cladorrhinum sp. PSN332]
MPSPNNRPAARRSGAIGERAAADASVPLGPSIVGYIGDAVGATKLVEAALLGRVAHMPRRPGDGEREHLIRSGNVFIYEEEGSGIKRWTDGHTWSPSRIMGNFLVYREIKDAFPPGQRKRALKKASHAKNAITKGYSAVPRGESSVIPDGIAEGKWREFVGSLTDSYDFKENGLVKKTISISVGGSSHHIVSYYNPIEAAKGHLQDISDLLDCWPRDSILGSTFRAGLPDEVLIHHGRGHWVPENVLEACLGMANGESHLQYVPVAAIPSAHQGHATHQGSVQQAVDWPHELRAPASGYEVQQPPNHQYNGFLPAQLVQHQTALLEEQEFGLHNNTQPMARRLLEEQGDHLEYPHPINPSMVPRHQSFSAVGNSMGGVMQAYGQGVNSGEERHSSVPALTTFGDDAYHGLPASYYGYGAGNAHQDYGPVQGGDPLKIEHTVENADGGQEQPWTSV